ncbi:MAG: hypothetical protein HY862_17545 [Chloroflexi bacterium]|nr:hypothetical protein [Chloroflexota bacterium]
MMDSNTSYNRQNIPRLTAHDAVRQRPGMYIGGADARALHHLVYEILDHMVEEAFVGRCDHIELTLLPENRVVIRDNSHGLPMSPYKDSGLTKMEAILVNLAAHKRDFEPELYAVTGGIHGMGLTVVNMLSAEMVVENARDGFLWRQVYREGLAQSSLEQIRPLDETEHGTTFSFVPDFTLLHLSKNLM